jgi:putative transposase
LRDIWQRFAEQDGWFGGRYVVMPDHVHLFAKRALEAKPLPDWMKT